MTTEPIISKVWSFCTTQTRLLASQDPATNPPLSSSARIQQERSERTEQKTFTKTRNTVKKKTKSKIANKSVVKPKT